MNRDKVKILEICIYDTIKVKDVFYVKENKFCDGFIFAWVDKIIVITKRIFGMISCIRPPNVNLDKYYIIQSTC